MIVLLSPAKSLDFEYKPSVKKRTGPIFQKDADKIARQLSKLSKKKLGDLMNLSDNLTGLNYDRYKSWGEQPRQPAIYAFTGDVYRGLAIRELDQKAIEFAQDHVRILSGLYGILKPLDEIEPYRLEMGTRYQVAKNEKNLYDHWQNKVTASLKKELQGKQSIVNLASNEYFKAIHKKELDVDIIDCKFKDFKNGQYKTIMTYAKEARGLMTRFIIENQIKKTEELQGFDLQGYRFDPDSSGDKELVFLRG